MYNVSFKVYLDKLYILNKFTLISFIRISLLATTLVFHDYRPGDVIVPFLEIIHGG